MAGLLALIGDTFGIGCGSNDDLTYDGAERWAAYIPMDKKAEVYFYTTQVGASCVALYSILDVGIFIMSMHANKVDENYGGTWPDVSIASGSGNALM